MTTRPLRQPRRSLLGVAVDPFLAMVVLLALDVLARATVAGLLPVACVFAGARAAGGA